MLNKTGTPALRLLAVIAIAGIAVLSGCASTGGNTTAAAPAGTAVQRIGFLSDYDRLQPVSGGASTVCWRTPGVDWAQYNKALIERIGVSIKATSTQPSVDPTDLKALTDYFHTALVKAVAPQMQEVNRAGPGVLRVRITLTDLVPTDATKSLVGTAIPYGFVGEMASGATDGRPAGSTPCLGETGMQAQFRDGASGAVIAECADTNIGRKYVADLSNGVPNAATQWANGYFDSFSTWSYAKRAFDDWSAFLAQRLQALRAG